MPHCRYPGDDAVEDCIRSDLGARERPETPGKFVMACPRCGGELSIEPGSHGARMVFHCHAKCRREQVALKRKMVEVYGRACITGKTTTRQDKQIAAGRELLRAGRLGGPDLRVRMAEILYDREMPRDWDGFLEFARNAGLADAYRVARRLGIQPRRKS